MPRARAKADPVENLMAEIDAYADAQASARSGGTLYPSRERAALAARLKSLMKPRGKTNAAEATAD